MVSFRDVAFSTAAAPVLASRFYQSPPLFFFVLHSFYFTALWWRYALRALWRLCNTIMARALNQACMMVILNCFPKRVFVSMYLCLSFGIHLSKPLWKHLVCKPQYIITNQERHFYFNWICRLWNSLQIIDTSLPVETTKWRYLWNHFTADFISTNPHKLHYLCPKLDTTISQILILTSLKVNQSG